MTPLEPPRYEQVYCFVALLKAFHKARRAKRGKGGEPAFYWNLEQNLLRLSRELATQTWEPAPYRYFTLRNIKTRTVSEASFRDRVVHHSLVATLEPSFEAAFIHNSYACRRDKGTHAALRRVHQLCLRHRYFLRMDIKRYFDAIDHRILLELLARRVSDPGILWLCKTLLQGSRVPTVPPGQRRGVPIGNLTSQFWANVYLDPLDHLVVDRLGVGSYARYMDDMVAFAQHKSELWELHQYCDTFLRDTLRLPLKPAATVVAPVTEGVPWLGFRVFAGTIRLRRGGRQRLGRKLRASMRIAALSMQAEADQVPSAASVCGHASAGHTLALRRDMLRRLLTAHPDWE